jgi:hydrogenase maturation protease
MKTLIICYGNPSRRDDGVAWYVADKLQAHHVPDVEILKAHQLEVDMAETIGNYEMVIFVDAAIPDNNPLPISREDVVPSRGSHAVAHYLTPGDLLALSRDLYGKQPRAVAFGIRGQDFNFGEELSPEVRESADHVVKCIEENWVCHA